jgi:NADH:ubiquinone oxidoreductase subunit E
LLQTSIKKLDALLKNRKKESSEIIEILQDVQKEYGYLPEETLKEISSILCMPLIEVFRVANFYKAFSLKPRGKYLVTVCMGTACHVRGAPKIIDEVVGQLAIRPGETTEDKMFTVEAVNCVGACALGPVVIINGKYYDHMSSSKLRALIESFYKQEKKK